MPIEAPGSSDSSYIIIVMSVAIAFDMPRTSALG